MEVTIDELDGKAIGIRLHSNQHSPLVKDDNKLGCKKICDAVIFIHDSVDTFYSILCELKSLEYDKYEKQKLFDGCNQLSSSRTLLYYLQRMINIHVNKNITFKDRYVVVFGNEKSEKLKTKQSADKYNYRDDITVKVFHYQTSIPVGALLSCVSQ